MFELVPRLIEDFCCQIEGCPDQGNRGMGNLYFRGRGGKDKRIPTSTTFNGIYQDRLYFLYASSATDLTNRMDGAGIGGGPYNGFKATVVSQWFYATPQTTVIPDESPSAMQVKVTNYPNGIGVATSAYIKSIVRFLELDPANLTSVEATWTAQIIARISINQTDQTITTDFRKPMAVEAAATSKASFFSVEQQP